MQSIVTPRLLRQGRVRLYVRECGHACGRMGARAGVRTGVRAGARVCVRVYVQAYAGVRAYRRTYIRPPIKYDLICEKQGLVFLKTTLFSKKGFIFSGHAHARIRPPTRACFRTHARVRTPAPVSVHTSRTGFDSLYEHAC